MGDNSLQETKESVKKRSRVFFFVVKRIFYLLPIMLGVSFALFFLIRLSPTDPIASITGGKRINEETRASLMRQFHLDQPLIKQYAFWITGFARGDPGMSYQYRLPVSHLLNDRLPYTLQLVFMAAVLAFLFAIPLGAAAAVKKNTALDRGLSFFMVLCVSSPPFLNAIVMILLFSLKAKLFPSFGTGQNFVENLYYLFLPALALSLSMTALLGRILRSRMIDELAASYPLALKASGTRFSAIVFKHCLKNAIIPVITVAGVWLGSMVVGAVLVENVFALGGIGSLLIDSIKTSDYPVVMSIIMLLILIFMMLSLVVDILYAAIDPRIKLG